MLGTGIELPPHGPVFHDVELLHPLMPLLLELADADGATRAMALMPFPSLLPGGLHAAELRALQNEPNPIDAFWSLSELLLQETVGHEGVAERSVNGVTVHGDGNAGDAPLLPQRVLDWLYAVFGLGVNGDKPGLRLVLLRDSVPTISALASRRLDPGDKTSMSGPYLVAEVGSFRPLWSIALPADQLPDAAVPLLRSAGVLGDVTPAPRLSPVHLAIVLRSPYAPPAPAVAPADDTSSSAVPGGLSVVVSGSDAARLEKLIESVRGAVAGEVEFLFRTPDPSVAISAAFDRACGQGWAPVPAGAELREISRRARYDTLLTISDRIGLGDHTLPTLLELLQRDESAASASCALLAETMIKKAVVLQPASGGLFPTGVSFASAPRLSFGEPDALQALPGLTYPVVANTLLLTVWRTGALAALPRLSGPVSAAGEDIRLGLDLMHAGYRNWCTTQVSARLAGPYARRDMIDPVGAAYLQPERWEDILGRVAVVRELF